MRKILYLLFGISILINSCTSNEMADYHPTIVVEGWIENGKPPVVLLTTTVPVNTDYKDQDSVIQKTINDAEVVVICDGINYSLKHKIDNRYYPSDIYTNEDLLGEEGKSYLLKITTAQGEHLSATTSIPQAVTVNHFTTESIDNKQTNHIIYAQIQDDLSSRKFYKAFVHIGDKFSEDFHSSFLGEYDNKLFNTSNPKIPIYSYRSSKQKQFNAYFQSGETVTIKLCHVDSIAYHFWNEYAKLLELSRNPIFTYRNNLPTNINGNGIGYWFGYGATRFLIHIP